MRPSPLPLALLLSALITGHAVASNCSGNPPQPPAPPYVFDTKTCEVLEYTVRVARPAPPKRSIPLKTISNVCPNCNSDGLVCLVQLAVGDTKTIEATIGQSIGVGISTTEVSFTYSTSFSSEATAGCQVNAPRCTITTISQEIFADATYQGVALERFEYRSCNYYRGDFWGNTLLGSNSGPAVSCGFEAEQVVGSALVRAMCKAPEHAKWPCPDPKCKECCPADNKGSSNVPSLDRRRPAIIVPPSGFDGGLLAGYVVDEQDRPIAGAQVQLSTDGTLGGTVYTDREGRFETTVPAGARVAQFAIAALGVAAVSRLNATEDPDSGSSFTQPGELVGLTGDYSRVSLEQAGVVRDLPVARAAAPDGKSVRSGYMVARDLKPGPVNVTLADAAGRRTTAKLNVYSVLEARIDRERLRGAQAGGFGWRFDFGAGLAGQVVPVCAKTEGPVSIEGQPCRDVRVQADGTAEFSGKVRAQKGFDAAFTINPVVGRPSREKRR